jgi:predicted phosphodiesterase
MKVFISGDIHGSKDIHKLNSKIFPEGLFLTKDDFVIITGDFGLLWSNEPDREEIWWINWLNEKPFTTLVIDGNHENHWRLLQLPLIEKFDAVVGKISNSIFHLKRGEIYNINNKKFFCMGGASSTDKQGRLIGYDWWPEEVPSVTEMYYGMNNLEKVNYTVDYILAHTLPKTMIKRLMAMYQISIEKFDDPVIYENTLDEVAKHMYDRYNDPTSSFLQEVCDRTKFSKFFCGHFHEDLTINNFHILYQKILQIF